MTLEISTVGVVTKARDQVEKILILGFPISDGNFIENPRKKSYFSDKKYQIQEVSCGAAHVAVVVLKKDESYDEAGYVYTWGLPFFGRLGYVDYSNEGKL